MTLIVDGVDLPCPRGVSPKDAQFYDPMKDFPCFDGSQIIPFSLVNDDYCDCQDGSDEPGTSACYNGSFHCPNAGYVELKILSSRVNDGICDCCDGSDEYISNHCENTCHILNAAAMARAEARAKVFSEGNELRLQLIETAKQMKQEKEERAKKLHEEKLEAEKVKEAAEAQKSAAEEAENAALEVYRAQEEEARQQKALQEQQEERNEAHEAFFNLDSNQNNLLELREIQVKQTFDTNKDGQVSDDEIPWYLNLKTEEVNEDMFFESIWPQIKPLYMLEKGIFMPPQPHQDEPTGGEETGEREEEKDQNEEGPEEDSGTDDSNQPEESHDEPMYDPHTTRLIEEAKEAKAQFESAEQALQNILHEINQIKEKSEVNYGPEDEYAPLDGQCYSYTDREYVYRLCPFNQVTQASKSGGAETRLGTWSKWSTADQGPVMIFENGQSCWNGPQRSTKVFVSCGRAHEVTSVNEPNKCEYEMHFETPAACKITTEVRHDEL